MLGNSFNFYGTDPLLGGMNFDAQLNELERMKQNIEQRQAAAKQMKEQAAQQSVQSQSPVWDEITAIVSGMTDQEFALVTQNEEFIQSNQVIEQILQAKYMEIMRPIVEGSKEGKDALDNHLTLIRRLKKSAASEVDRQVSDFKEYTERYADMPYSEYVKMKSSKAKGGKK